MPPTRRVDASFSPIGQALNALSTRRLSFAKSRSRRTENGPRSASWGPTPGAGICGSTISLAAFESDLTGGDEVYVLNLASGERIRVTKDGGVMPRWRRDGRELFCISSQHVVSIAPGRNDDWHNATASPLFSVTNVQGFDAAPD